MNSSIFTALARCKLLIERALLEDIEERKRLKTGMQPPINSNSVNLIREAGLILVAAARDSGDPNFLYTTGQYACDDIDLLYKIGLGTAYGGLYLRGFESSVAEGWAKYAPFSLQKSLLTDTMVDVVTLTRQNAMVVKQVWLWEMTDHFSRQVLIGEKPLTAEQQFRRLMRVRERNAEMEAKRRPLAKPKSLSFEYPEDHDPWNAEAIRQEVFVPARSVRGISSPFLSQQISYYGPYCEF